MVIALALTLEVGGSIPRNPVLIFFLLQGIIINNKYTSPCFDGSEVLQPLGQLYLKTRREPNRGRVADDSALLPLNHNLSFSSFFPEQSQNGFWLYK